MQRILILCFLLLSSYYTSAQTISGIVADMDTHEPLPFATLKLGSSQQGTLTDIKGRFSIQRANTKEIQFSYVGYEPLTIALSQITDTIFLSRRLPGMQEIVIRPPYEKIRRIINTAIANKPSHDPNHYDWYRCHIYYKMQADILAYGPESKEDTGLMEFTEQNHLVVTETYTERTYKNPGKLQQIMLASRFSGLKKTYFTNLVTDFLPFDVYGDFIKLNGKDYLHPISNGWQQRYDFGLVDELLDGADTIYILSYKPKKNSGINALNGIVYINTNGFAISNLIANTDDTLSDRYVHMQQVYRNVQGKWFPRELNYEYILKNYPVKGDMGVKLIGHSIIDSVSFTENKDFHFDKTHPVKMHDSIDLRSDAQWQAYRFDTLTTKEKHTYQFIDSISDKYHIERYISGAGRAGAAGMVAVGPIDIDLKRILAFNTYEGTRLGLGLFTNDRFSKYFALGGWFGYGFKDGRWKYGIGGRIYPTGTKEHWLEMYYQETYQNSGSINFHRELDRNFLKQWLLARVDLVKEYSVTGHIRAGYWEIEPQAKVQELTPQYDYTFNEPGVTNRVFDVQEGSIGLRYAFREKRSPIFGYYLAQKSKYPIAYLRLSGGNISSGEDYKTNYWRALAAVTYDVHINRWGTDNFRLEGGMIQTGNNTALPRSFLLAGNGYRMTEQLQWYAWGGFITMNPFDYYTDGYASLLYRHDFDWRLYNNKFSSPYISLAHNMLYGNLHAENEAANPGATAPIKGYHETGIILNRIVRFNYWNMAYVNLNIAGFYHWDGPFDWDNQGRIALGLSFEL